MLIIRICERPRKPRQYTLISIKKPSWVESDLQNLHAIQTLCADIDGRPRENQKIWVFPFQIMIQVSGMFAVDGAIHLETGKPFGK
jgi:hypothetical protein